MMHLVADSRLWDFAGWAAIFTMLTSSAEDMADGQTILGACGTGEIGMLSSVAQVSFLCLNLNTYLKTQELRCCT